MLLPRPARLIRQCPQLLRPFVQRGIAAQALRAVQPVDVDESYHPYMDDMSMGSRQRQTAAEENRHVLHVEESTSYETAASSSDLMASSDQNGVLEDEEGGREERRSPATILGSKRVGLVVLPHQLTQAIQQEINSELLGGFGVEQVGQLTA